MAFTATFYTFSKRINSTKQPSGGTSYDIILKAGSSALSPTISLDVGQSGNPTAYNYCYIPTYGRYYWVSDWIFDNRLWTAVCKSDPMASWKSYIGSYTAYISRAASSYNLSVMDGKYPTIADVDTVLTSLSDISNNIITTGTIVLGLKSKLGTQGVAYYAMDAAKFSDFISYLYSDSWLDLTEGDISLAIQKMLVDPFDYIVSCNWFPFSISGTETSVYFGFWDWTGHTAYRIPESARIRTFNHAGTLPDHPQVARGTYLNCTPYTRLTMDLYAFGRCILDPDKFTDSRSFSVNLAIDIFTGIGRVTVNSTNGVVYKSTATCSVPIQLSQVRTDLTRPIIDTAGAAVSLATENYVGMAASIADAVKSMLPQISSIGAVGSIAAYAYSAPDIESNFYRIADEDLTSIGRPLCSTRTISSLSGYIMCEDADPEIPCTDSELREIVSSLNSGFYYE